MVAIASRLDRSIALATSRFAELSPSAIAEVARAFTLTAVDHRELCSTLLLLMHDQHLPFDEGLVMVKKLGVPSAGPDAFNRLPVAVRFALISLVENIAKKVLGV